MASVFLSYDRDDAGKARPLALALEKAGHSVWWDLHVRGGAQFSKVIEEALKAADAVVVLWSARAVESAWVRDEAAAGRDTGRLVPVSLDRTEPPLGFRQFQTIDLSRWRGRGRVPRLDDLVAAIDALDGSGEKAPAPPPSAGGEARKRIRRALPIALASIAILLVGSALLLWRPWQERPMVPIVAVVPAEQTASASTLARDLFVQLGRLQATNPNAIRLVGTASDRPDFILEASSGTHSGEATAALVLMTGKDRHLLWSRDYRQPSASTANLRQQLAYSAALVLECAAEAMAARLSEQSRKLYLSGCAQFAESGGADATVVQTFEKAALAAPRFRDVWGKLLLAQSELASNWAIATGNNEDVAGPLRRHIAQARKHHGDFPELLVAELELLPEGNYAERLALADRAKELGPDNPHALAARARELLSVGRNYEAIIDAERALQLDPLSPAMRNRYINTLAYSGRLAAAAEALEEAERIWPGAASVVDAKFRFHLRYGDPAVALQLFRSEEGTSTLHEATLKARLNPTPENLERAAQLAEGILKRRGEVMMYSQILAELGREEQVYSTIANLRDPLSRLGTDLLFRPTLKRFREDRRFMLVAKRLGLIDYWRTSGKWPDFCFEPGLPYDCKAEAAKLA